MAAILSVQLIDARGRVTRRKYEITDQADLAAYQAVSVSFLGALEDITDLGLVRADLVIPYSGTTWAAVANSNIDVGATFTGILYDKNGARAAHKVPGIKNALVSGDGTIQITGDVDTYLTEFENGEDFALSDGEQIDTWLRGVLDK